jgi:K(+)-stimulated pyrophosphate-energized sodium pump
MLFVGGMIPVVFSALAMNSVGKAAMDMVYEVRRQFKEIPGIMEGTAKPEYAKCVDISTKAALREMMLPGVLTLGFPIAIVLLGKLVYGDNNQLIAEMLGGYMAELQFREYFGLFFKTMLEVPGIMLRNLLKQV